MVQIPPSCMDGCLCTSTDAIAKLLWAYESSHFSHNWVACNLGDQPPEGAPNSNKSHSSRPLFQRYQRNTKKERTHCGRSSSSSTSEQKAASKLRREVTSSPKPWIMSLTISPSFMNTLPGVGLRCWGCNLSGPAEEPLGKDLIVRATTASSTRKRLKVVIGGEGIKESGCGVECFDWRAVKVSPLKLASLSSEHVSCTAPLIFPSSNLEETFLLTDW